MWKWRQSALLTTSKRTIEKSVCINGPHLRDMKQYGSCACSRQIKNILTETKPRLSLSVISCAITLQLRHFTLLNVLSLLQPWTQVTERNYCYMFTIRSSVKSTKTSLVVIHRFYFYCAVKLTKCKKAAFNLKKKKICTVYLWSLVDNPLHTLLPKA